MIYDLAPIIFGIGFSLKGVKVINRFFLNDFSLRNITKDGGNLRYYYLAKVF